MKHSERLGIFERVRALYSVLRLTSLAVMVVSVTVYSSTYEEAGAFIEPTGKNWLLSHRDYEPSDFNSAIHPDMYRLFRYML